MLDINCLYAQFLPTGDRKLIYRVNYRFYKLPHAGLAVVRKIQNGTTLEKIQKIGRKSKFVLTKHNQSLEPGDSVEIAEKANCLKFN